METTFKQKQKIGVAGSFINQLMGNNSSIPEVGKGATRLSYSDRHCYEVIEVSSDLKTVKLEALDAIADKSKPLGMGHQNWILNPTGRYKTIVWRYGKWCVERNVVMFTKAFLKECKAKGITFIGGHLQKNNPEIYRSIYGDTHEIINAVAGYTEFKKEYTPISIIFGIKDYHYDWEF